MHRGLTLWYARFVSIQAALEFVLMAKTTASKRMPWSKHQLAELRRHSKAGTPVAKVAKRMKRTEGALRQQALRLGIGLGHRR